MDKLVPEETTIGDLIRTYRQKADMSQVDVEKQCGVKQGRISKIEKGEIKKPDFNILLSLSPVINIPLTKIISCYIKIEDKSEALYDILNIAITTSDTSLVKTVAQKFLSDPNKDSMDLLDKLYNMTKQTEANDNIKLALYNTLVDYARDHGVQSSIAKGIFQKYLIERNDFSRLNKTYVSGTYVLQYTKFLSQDEQVTLYHKLGVHALNLRKYNESIELCTKAFIEDQTESTFKAYSTLTIFWFYYYLEDFEQADKFLKIFSLFNFEFIKEHETFMSATLNTEKGHIDLAISQYEQCLDFPSLNKLNCINGLIRLYLIKEDLQSIGELIQKETITETKLKDPFIRKAEAQYYLNKSNYYNLIGKQEESLNALEKSVFIYSELTEQKEIFECLELLCHINKNTDNPKIEKRITNLFKKLKSTKECALT